MSENPSIQKPKAEKATNAELGRAWGGWRRHKHKACQHRMPERFFRKEFELARSMLGGAQGEPGKRKPGESTRSAGMPVGYAGGGFPSQEQ